MTDTMYSHLDELFRTKISSRDNHGLHTPEASLTAKPLRSPVWPESPTTDTTAERKAFWNRLRTFYREGHGGGLRGADQKPTHFPALLAPFRDWRHVRNDYPVWMADEAGENMMQSLTTLLAEAVLSFAPGPADARILKDNLARLELIVREAFDDGPDVQPWADVIGPALRRMESRLDIAGQDGANFSDDIKKLLKALPSSGRLAVFSGQMPFLCLSTAMASTQTPAKLRLLERISGLRSQLQSLLTIEREKSPDSRSPEVLQGSYGYGASFINFDRFSNVLPEAATLPMPAERVRRIEKIVNVLERAPSFFAYDAIFCVTTSFSEQLPSGDVLSRVKVHTVEGGNACAGAQNVFDNAMARMAELFAAVRVADLEIKGHYDPEIHDPYFAGFDWQSFDDAELSACPPVVLLSSVAEIMNHELADFSGLLASCRPIKALVLKQEMPVPGGRMNEWNFTFQQEIGSLAVSHRNTYVLQSTTIHPVTLFSDFSAGLSSPTPALFYLLAPKDLPAADSFLLAGTALEGRAFPEFTYDQRQGVRWGSRFNVARNPHPDQDWPSYELKYEDHGQPVSMTVPFTVADGLALANACQDQFLPVPRSCWSEDLVLFSDFLTLPSNEAYAKIPFIWMLDDQQVLTKVATTHWMTLLAQERLDFWHFIQEFGGINSFHVEKAVEQVRKEMRDEHAREMAVLEERHRLELEEARRQTARETMEKLSSILLDLDTTVVMPTSSAVVPAATTTAAIAPPPPASVVPIEEEAVISADPWIETFRCTSCNECTNLNPNGFKYDGNKQAYIADAGACTFAQLVTAAEKCPAKCIHPGKPLNPAEPGLEALLVRAAPFN